MRRQASFLVLALGLSACLAARRGPITLPPPRPPIPTAVASASPPPPPPAPPATPAASDSASEPCSDPAEAAYLSACQADDTQADDSDTASEPEELNDGLEDQSVEPPHARAQRAPNPFAALSDQQLRQKYKDDPESVGSLSVGATNAGALVNGVAMPRGDHWELIDPAHAWGTQETVDALTTAINKVYERYPDSPPMQIGHISARHGGALSPHVSHQAGRDVDVSYYLTTPTRYFTRATADNLDRARTWTFVRALITETDVEMILIDRSIQKLLRDYALSIGESASWLDEIFDGKPGMRAIVLHAKGHANHMHVRFYNPVAQETARRLQPVLPKTRLAPAPAPDSYVLHRARSGDTLVTLARRYGTSVEAIQAANGLHGTAIKARQVYKIPRPAKAQPAAPAQPARRGSSSRHAPSHR